MIIPKELKELRRKDYVGYLVRLQEQKRKEVAEDNKIRDNLNSLYQKDPESYNRKFIQEWTGNKKPKREKNDKRKLR